MIAARSLGVEDQGTKFKRLGRRCAGRRGVGEFKGNVLQDRLGRRGACHLRPAGSVLQDVRNGTPDGASEGLNVGDRVRQGKPVARGCLNQG